MKLPKILPSVALVSVLGAFALPGTAAAHTVTETVRVITVSHGGHAPKHHHKQHKQHKHQHRHQGRPLGYAPPPVYHHPPRPVYYEPYPPVRTPQVSIRIRL